MEPSRLLSRIILSCENISACLPANTTDLPYTDLDLVQTVIPPYIITLCVLGLLGNGFVLLVFLIHKDKLSVPEIYLGNLALADFILLAWLPFWALYISNEFNWLYGEALCKIVNSSIMVNFYTSIYIVAMISVDRYLALVMTMKARWMRRTLYAKVICAILWLFGFLMSIPMIVYRKVRFFEQYNSLSCTLEFDASWKLANQVLLNVVGFVLPVLVIVFCSCSIIISLYRRIEVEGSHSQGSKDRKATVLVYAVTLLFLICWGPFQIFTFLDTLLDLQLLDDLSWYETLDVGHQVSVYLAFLNSALNPLLYVFSGQYFRRKVTAIYRRKRYGRRGSDMTVYQRSVISTYLNRTEQIKPVIHLYNKN